MNKLIIVVDDEPDILELVSIHLDKAGYEVKTFEDANGLYEFLEAGKEPTLLILDLMLPDCDGLDVCRDFKKDERYSNIPIIMLTARTEEIDKILGLELGADDYVTKPFSPRELMARVKAVLRRVEKGENDGPEPTIIKVGDSIVLNLQKYEVTVDGKKVDLTPTEFKILRMLSKHKGWVFSRQQILDYLWGDEKIVIDRTVDVHVTHLRDKLGPKAGKMIKNVRGVGYKLKEE